MLRAHNRITTFEMPAEGYVLQPNILYLGVTQEYTETHAHVPFLEGKSSVGRLGIDILATAGKGDVGLLQLLGPLEIKRVHARAGVSGHAHRAAHLLRCPRRRADALQPQAVG
ncbi:MAG: hypothetical protein WKG07_05405 [Hymenobacter sp.]